MRIRAGMCLVAATYGVAGALAFSPVAGADPDCPSGQSARMCARDFCPAGERVDPSGACGREESYRNGNAEPALPPLIGLI